MEHPEQNLAKDVHPELKLARDESSLVQDVDVLAVVLPANVNLVQAYSLVNIRLFSY